MRVAQSVGRSKKLFKLLDKILRLTHIFRYMKIRAYRKQRKLTLKQMAERWETDAGNLSRVERGVQRPGIDLAERISRDSGLTLDEIFSESRRQCAA